MADWLVGRLTGWMDGLLVGSLDDWLTGCLLPSRGAQAVGEVMSWLLFDLVFPGVSFSVKLNGQEAGGGCCCCCRASNELKSSMNDCCCCYLLFSALSPLGWVGAGPLGLLSAPPHTHTPPLLLLHYLHLLQHHNFICCSCKWTTQFTY